MESRMSTAGTVTIGPEQLEGFMFGNLVIRGIIEDLPRPQDATFFLPTVRTILHVLTGESDDHGKRIFMHARHVELHTESGSRNSADCFSSLVGLRTHVFQDGQAERKLELIEEIGRWKALPPWMAVESRVVCRKVGEVFISVPMDSLEIIEALARLEVRIAYEIRRPDPDLQEHNQYMLRGLFDKVADLIQRLNSGRRGKSGETNFLCCATCKNLWDRITRNPRSVSVVSGAAQRIG